jgi:putative flippase GtrA
MDRAKGPAPSSGSRRTGIERVGRHRPVVDVVVPVFNEEEQVAASIRRLAPSAASQARRFAAIGVVSTLAYLAIYSLLRTGTTAPAANAIALIVTAVGNTAANRRLTFDVRGRESLGRDHLAGLVAFGLALSITSAAVALLGGVAPASGRVVELAVLTAANSLATLARFLVLRWVLVSSRHPNSAPVQLQRTVS